MTIIKFSGKPIEKLIDTVSNAIGVLYEPSRIRKVADAEVYRLEKMEEVLSKNLIIKADTEMQIFERMRARIDHSEINRQINLENIVEKSTKHLGETVSDKAVDEDWRTRFFSKAQDVKNDEMQEIWSKILAEEITQPGKVSFRTLDAIANISKTEAQLFENACKIAFNDGMILKLNRQNSIEDYGINYSDLLMLRSAGLIYESDNLNITYKHNVHFNGAILIFGEKLAICSKENCENYTFNQIKFTPVGLELMRVINVKKNYNYLESFVTSEKIINGIEVRLQNN